MGVLNARRGVLFAMALHDVRREARQFAFIGTQRVARGGALIRQDAEILGNELVQLQRGRGCQGGVHADSSPESTGGIASPPSWCPDPSAESRRFDEARNCAAGLDGNSTRFSGRAAARG